MVCILHQMQRLKSSSANFIHFAAELLGPSAHQIEQTIGTVVGLRWNINEMSEQVVDINASCLRDILHLDSRTDHNEESLHL